MPRDHQATVPGDCPGFCDAERLAFAKRGSRRINGTVPLAMAAILTWLATATGAVGSERERFEVAAWVDHFDFATHFDGEKSEGLAKILDHVQETGATTILWRNCSGSTMRYPSREESHNSAIQPDKRRVPDGRPVYGWLHYGETRPDIVATVVAMCKARGLRPGIHWPFEETHWQGWTFGEFNLEHPQYWGRTAMGQPWPGRTSLAYEPVMRHKLALADELVARGIEVLFIDFRRTGAWSPAYEYVEPVTTSYRQKYGKEPPEDPKDPTWCRHVSEYVTAFVRRLRERLRASGRPIELAVGIPAIAPQSDIPLIAAGVDWRRWVDEGLIDTLVIDHVEWDKSEPLESTRRAYREVLGFVRGRCRVWCPVEQYDYDKHGMPSYQKATGKKNDDLAGLLTTMAHEEGAHGISLECVDYNNYAPATREALRRLTTGECRWVKTSAPGQAAAASGDTWRQQRRAAAHRHRRLVFDNDGCDAVYFCPEATEEAFLKSRMTGLVGTHVDTIVYCTWSSPFGCFTHATKVGDVFTSKESLFAKNKTAEFLKQGTDPLRMTAGFSRKNGIEVFWSMRMNDTHDAWGGDYSPLMVSRVKQQHPEYLLGSKEKRTKHGGWSAIDYGRPEVRELAFRYVEEVCRGYDVDGVLLDFFRHPLYFRSQAEGRDATDGERGMMSDLVSRIHAMTDEVGQKRARPILVAVRVPDSAECSAAIGLDIVRWLKEQWIDILVVSDYFRLNPWETSVQLGHQYHVPVYPSLSESRVAKPDDAFKIRNSPASYRAQAAEAWQAGADGLFIFNQHNPNWPCWRELGDMKTIAPLERVYFASVRGQGSLSFYIPHGERFKHVPSLCPASPLNLSPGQPAKTEILLAEDFASGANPSSPLPRVEMQVWTDAITDAASVKTTFNGQLLPEGRMSDRSILFTLDPKTLRRGVNLVEFALKPGTPGKPRVQDLLVWIRPSAETAPKKP